MLQRGLFTGNDSWIVSAVVLWIEKGDVYVCSYISRVNNLHWRHLYGYFYASLASGAKLVPAGICYLVFHVDLRLTEKYM